MGLFTNQVCHGETNGDLGKCDTLKKVRRVHHLHLRAYQHAMGCTALGSTVDS